MREEPWRALSPDERRVIERLLEKDFPGRDALRSQLDGAQARPADEEGSLDIHVAGGERSIAPSPVPAYAACPDADGFEVELLLLLRDGRLSRLEVHKEDGSALIHWPNAARLRIY